MTDNELLGFAAQSAGYAGYPIVEEGVLLQKSVNGLPPVFWNPLKHDHQAFRLMTLHEMTVSASRSAVTAAPEPSSTASVTVNIGDSRSAATRRAITLCAAEIGRDQ
ncbi:MAG: hypothetical protein GX665_05340 [Gammaproteobacteria bacterium]|nr:hypothetical protein [Gammaproteobacteria bacterium]